VLDLARLYPGNFKTIAGRMRGESGGVLDPVETLLLRGGDELTVHNDRRAGVAVVSVET
jgi:hypothetical protein